MNKTTYFDEGLHFVYEMKKPGSKGAERLAAPQAIITLTGIWGRFVKR